MYSSRCHSSGWNTVKCPHRCPWCGQNMIKCPERGLPVDKCGKMSPRTPFQWTKHSKLSSRFLPNDEMWWNIFFFSWCPYVCSPLPPETSWVYHCSSFAHYALKFLWKPFSHHHFSHRNDSKKLVSLWENKVNYPCLMQFQINAKHLSNFCLVERSVR